MKMKRHVEGCLCKAMMATNLILFNSWDCNQIRDIPWARILAIKRYKKSWRQNEIINLMSNQIMMNFLQPSRSCILSVMCDECTDASNKEQLPFSLRWVNNDLKVSEKFVGFYEILDLKSSTIVTVMKDILLRFQLNLDLCRGQRYDGASNISGKSSGCYHLDFYRTTKRTLFTLPCSFAVTFGRRCHQKC